MELRCWSGGNGEIGVSWNAVLMTGINVLSDTYMYHVRNIHTLMWEGGIISGILSVWFLRCRPITKTIWVRNYACRLTCAAPILTRVVITLTRMNERRWTCFTFSPWLRQWSQGWKNRGMWWQWRRKKECWIAVCRTDGTSGIWRKKWTMNGIYKRYWWQPSTIISNGWIGTSVNIGWDGKKRRKRSYIWAVLVAVFWMWGEGCPSGTISWCSV